MHLPSVLYDFSEKSETVFFNISFVYIKSYFLIVASGNRYVFLLYPPIVTSLYRSSDALQTYQKFT